MSLKFELCIPSIAARQDLRHAADIRRYRQGEYGQCRHRLLRQHRGRLQQQLLPVRLGARPLSAVDGNRCLPYRRTVDHRVASHRRLSCTTVTVPELQASRQRSRFRLSPDFPVERRRTAWTALRFFKIDTSYVPLKPSRIMKKFMKLSGFLALAMALATRCSPPAITMTMIPSR